MAAPTLTPAGIRSDLITRLTGATVAGARVYDSRKDALNDKDGVDLPALCVYTQTTRRERLGMSGGNWRATLRISIVGYVTGDGDAALAAAADVMELAIVETLLGDEEWTGVFNSVETVEAQKPLHGGTKVEVGEVGIAFEVVYPETYYPASSTREDLDEIAVTTDTTYPDGADVSERNFEVPQ